MKRNLEQIYFRMKINFMMKNIQKKIFHNEKNRQDETKFPDEIIYKIKQIFMIKSISIIR